MSDRLARLAQVRHEWNKPDENGDQIEPPLSVEEVESFERHSVYPDVTVKFNFKHDKDTEDKRKAMTAKMVLIACSGVRQPTIPGYNPDLVSRVFLEGRKKAAEE